MLKVCRLLAPLVIGAAFTAPAMANGLFENPPWQFETPSEKIANVSIVDLIERKKGGFFDSFDINNTINNTTNIDGDQINCNVTSTATGNANSGATDATIASPVGLRDNQIIADAAGSNSELSQVSGDGSDGDQLVDLAQTNSGTQTATNSKSDIFSTIGTQNLNGTADQVLNNDQNISDDVEIESEIENSTACLNP
ncbi:MAG: hypothetical protein GY791_20940 [Alphaproteobacteria bacterium]|nr:hypothetical protein [Alphaproteobacteria bacterium]